MDPHPFGLLQVIVAAGDTTTDSPAREGGNDLAVWDILIQDQGCYGCNQVFNPSRDVLKKGVCCVRWWLRHRV